MEKENCLYLQVAHCNKCGGESGYNIYDGEKVCFDCGEPYKADFSVSKVESTITTTNTQPKEEVTAEWLYRKNRKRLEDLTEKELKKRGITKTQDTPEEKEEWEKKLDGLIYGITVSSTTTLEEGWKLKDPKKLKKELDKLNKK